MKERFWFVYYWLMLGYLGLGLIILVISLLTFHDRDMESGLICDRYLYEDYYPGLHSCLQGNNVPMIIYDINEYLFFDFIGYDAVNGRSSINGLYRNDFVERKISMSRDISFNNIYPFLLIFVMTLVRWISIGKHIWQRP